MGSPGIFVMGCVFFFVGGLARRKVIFYFGVFWGGLHDVYTIIFSRATDIKSSKQH